MQRVAIIVPFANSAVEYEFQRLVSNKNIIYQIFRIDYKTHQSDNDDQFYQELEHNLDRLLEKILVLNFDKIILMCSSLGAKTDNKKIISANKIASEYILKNKLNQKLILISPYSKNTTNQTINDFKGFGVIFNQVIIKSLFGALNYFNFGEELTNFCLLNNIKNKEIFISCTNIPIVNCINEINVLSTNYIVASFLNSLQ